MKRSPIRKIGKRGKLNSVANTMIKKMWIEKDIRYCQLPFPHDCNQGMGLTNAHRHKRSWYLGKSDRLLWDFNQVIRVCLNGHELIEYDAEKTAEVFEELRGVEIPLDKHLKKV